MSRRPAPELHTRYLAPVTPARPEKRRCANPKCKAEIRTGNPRTLCDPCGRGEIDLPGWAVELAQTMKPSDLAALAKVLRDDLHVGVVAEDQPDPDAPECACGCGARMLRPMSGGAHSHRRTTGPYQRFMFGHGGAARPQGKEVTDGETGESREPLESGSQQTVTS